MARTCDLMYHFTAEAKHAFGVLKPVETIIMDLKRTLNVLEVARRYYIPVIYPSSCEIYGDSEEPIKEDHPLNPPNPYAASKAAADRICYIINAME